jgi:hypothetical protein
MQLAAGVHLAVEAAEQEKRTRQVLLDLAEILGRAALQSGYLLEASCAARCQLGRQSLSAQACFFLGRGFGSSRRRRGSGRVGHEEAQRRLR